MTATNMWSNFGSKWSSPPLVNTTHVQTVSCQTHYMYHPTLAETLSFKSKSHWVT